MLSITNEFRATYKETGLDGWPTLGCKLINLALLILEKMIGHLELSVTWRDYLRVLDVMLQGRHEVYLKYCVR